MARASRGERCEKEKSPFATTLMQLMNEQPITTQAQLAEITGKTRQTISQYVNGISEPGYDTLVKIADHFQVSLDYLLGRTNEPSMHPSAVDELCVSSAAINQLRYFSCTEHHSEELSLLMENRLFWSIIREIIAFKKAAAAEGIYDSIQLKYHTSDDVDCISEMESRDKMDDALSMAVSDESIDETTRRYLSSLIYLNNLTGTDGQFADDAFVRYFVPSEIHEQRINRYLHGLLEQINTENPIHDLRRVFVEAARTGHISYDHAGNAHYSSRKQGDDYDGND